MLLSTRLIRPARASTSDIIVDVRVAQHGIKKMIGTLERLGYKFDGANDAGIGHRFVRGPVHIDLLAPDGIGLRADISTCAGARTVKVPGGTQALERSEWVEIRVGRRKGKVPRPNLLGAILIKARAVGVDDVPQNQREELCFLLSLVEDPVAMATQLEGRERNWLRQRDELLEASHPAWLRVDNAEDGRLAFRILVAR